MTHRAPCTCCDSTEYGVDGARDFPTVQLCPPCKQGFITWMLQHKVLHGNPLAIQWFDAPTEWIVSPEGGSRGVRIEGFVLVPECYFYESE